MAKNRPQLNFLRPVARCVIFNMERESQNTRPTIPNYCDNYISQPFTIGSSGRLFSFPEDCITQSYESDNEDTYLDQIRICNKHWHRPPFYRPEGDAPSKYGGVGRLLCVPDYP